MGATVRPATAEDNEAIARSLGRAFTDDPIWRWIYPQPDRTGRLTVMFSSLMPVMHRRGATILTDETANGVAIWQRHDARGYGVTGKLRMGVSMFRGRPRIRRGMAMLREIERRHPKEPHLYLAVLGTDPAHQGKGIGSSLIHEVLDDPSNVGEPAYLETETEENVAFYYRHGFEVIDEFDTPMGGPHIWLLWRDPRDP